MKLSSLVMSACVAIVAIGGTAFARDVPVSARGVDFANARDVDALHRAIASAAIDACRVNARLSASALRLVRACRVESIDRAVADANRPTLTALNSALDASLRINPARPALNATAIAAVTAAARLRAEAQTGVTRR